MSDGDDDADDDHNEGDCDNNGDGECDGALVCCHDYGNDIDDVIVMWLSNDYGNNLDKHDRWFHGMETFSASLVLCEWNPPVTYGIPWQWSHDAIMFFFYFDERLNKRMNKQWSCRWF